MEHHSKYGAFDNRSAFLFHELLRQVLPNGEGRKSYKKGDHIFEEGKHANGLFCVMHGKVKICRIGEGGKEQIVRLAGPRDVIGYRALLAGDLYHASAIALEDTMVGFAPKKFFFDLLNTNPEIALQMLRLLSQDLDHSENKIVDIATKTVRERLAEVFFVLKQTYGLEADGLTLNVNLSRDEIAGMVGAATEVVIRNMAQLKDEGLIEARGRHIKLIDVPALLRIAKLTE